MSYKKLWIVLSLVIVGSLAVLGYYGWQIYQMAPPVPQKVITTSGKVLFTREQIQDGQNVWQSIGGQEVGTVWGHGAYVAPDWSADWLHRELVFILDAFATQQFGKTYEALDAPAQAALRARLKAEIRPNTFNAQTGELVVSDTRAKAIATVESHYISLFTADPAFSKLRDAYAIPANSIKDPERLKALNAFFFWT